MISRAACRFSSCRDGGGILLLDGGRYRTRREVKRIMERKDLRRSDEVVTCVRRIVEEGTILAVDE